MEDYYYNYSEEEHVDWAYIVTLLVICVVGMFGNLLVMFVVISSQEYKKAVTHWYVLQLSIADTCFLLTLPIRIDEDIHKEWRYSSNMCKAKETILFLNYYASIMFLMIMSIDRYIAVCHRFADFLQRLRSYSAAYIITGVTWIIALILCTPIILYSDKVNCFCTYVFPMEDETPEEFCKKEGYIEETANWFNCIDVANSTLSVETECGPKNNNLLVPYGNDSFIYSGDEISDYDYNFTDYKSDYSENFNTSAGPSLFPECHYYNSGYTWTVMIVFNFSAMFAVPVLVMGFCYTMIVIQLRKTKLKSNKSRRSSSSENIRKQRTTKKKRRHSNASLKAENNRNRVITVCIVFVLLFVRTWCRLLPTVATMILYMNSALNPYIYNFLGTKFGKRFRVASSSVRQRVNRHSSWSSYGSSKFKLKKKNSAGEIVNSSQNSSGTVFSKGKSVEVEKITYTNVQSSTDDGNKRGETRKEDQLENTSIKNDEDTDKNNNTTSLL